MYVCFLGCSSLKIIVVAFSFSYYRSLSMIIFIVDTFAVSLNYEFSNVGTQTEIFVDALQKRRRDRIFKRGGEKTACVRESRDIAVAVYRFGLTESRGSYVYICGNPYGCASKCACVHRGVFRGFDSGHIISTSTVYARNETSESCRLITREAA